jgi:hypothetical protein
MACYLEAQSIYCAVSTSHKMTTTTTTTTTTNKGRNRSKNKMWQPVHQQVQEEIKDKN